MRDPVAITLLLFVAGVGCSETVQLTLTPASISRSDVTEEVFTCTGLQTHQYFEIDGEDLRVVEDLSVTVGSEETNISLVSSYGIQFRMAAGLEVGDHDLRVLARGEEYLGRRALHVFAGGDGDADGDTDEPIPDAETDVSGCRCGECGCRTEECDPRGHVSRLSSGRDHVCAIRADETLHCWGRNHEGQLGDGTKQEAFRPIETARGSIDAGWARVSAGGAHTCAVRISGRLYCWGKRGGASGEPEDGVLPAPVDDSYSWTEIGAGDNHSCAIREDGTLFCWGENRFGELGLGFESRDPILDPTAVGERVWRLVFPRLAETCALGSDETLWCWGHNSVGGIGVGHIGGRLEASRVGIHTSWSGISSGSAATHACGFGTSAGLHCWGNNLHGQLGLGDSGSDSHRLVPELVDVENIWEDVSVGGMHSCAIRRDGTLWCWGTSSSGALGVGDESDPALTPVQVGSGTSWIQVSAGFDFTCAIREDGTLWCWGRNTFGQLGLGDHEDRATPALVCFGDR